MVEDARLTRLTEMCLGLPEVSREVSGRHASFAVRGKKFVYFLDDHHGDGIVAVCWRAPGENEALVAMDPTRFYKPAYIGPRGWVGLRLDIGEVDWADVADFVADSYTITAPRRLVELLDRRSR